MHRAMKNMNSSSSGQGSTSHTRVPGDDTKEGSSGRKHITSPWLGQMYLSGQVVHFFAKKSHFLDFFLIF